uniref:Zinc finger and BTB domain containing 38 n=1 Tax=Anser brachyrhynchus TaxID=132585 RepID=A0A8B9C4T7_9AVES
MTVMSHSKDLKDDFHSDTVLSILNEQRIRGILCDVTIIVEDTKFKAHSNVLAASSLYFKNIFWSRTICISGHVLELDDLKAEVFTEILNYIYSSTVVVKRQETVTDLAAAGKKLGISFLEDLTDVNFSSSPCPYAYCINEKGTVKEEKHEKRHEESAVTNGPRITNSQGTGLAVAKAPASTVTNTETPREAVNDQRIISFPKPQNKAGDFHLPREEENKSANVSGSAATVVPPAYNCNCCAKSFSDRALLSTHLQLHSEHQETFVCKYCSKQFANLNILESHEQVCMRSKTDHLVKVVDGQILYTCIVCKRSYVTLSSLRRHANVHSWRRTYPCHYCNKVFALAEYRTRHEIWHTGERRYQDGVGQQGLTARLCGSMPCNNHNSEICAGEIHGQATTAEDSS